jgi:hypothetical protein
MPRQTAIATVGGLIVGIALTTTAVRKPPSEPTGGILLQILAHFGPAIACTVIGVTVFRRWLDDYSALSQREMTAAAEQRRLFLQEITNHQADITRREAQLNRSAQASEARITEAVKNLVNERASHARLQADYDELADDFNRVVSATLQQSADRFWPRPAGPADNGAPCIPLPARSRQRGDVTHQQARDITDPSLLR